MTNLYEWTGVEMLEVYIMRRTLSYLSSLAKYGNDRWEVQMLGAEFEARNDGKRDGRRLTAKEKTKKRRHDGKKRHGAQRKEERCRYCGDSFSAEKHVFSCEKAPWTEWAKGVRWRADLRNKRFTAEEMGTWQHRCVHCEVSFPCRSGLTRHANECRKRRAREGLSL